MNSTYTEERMPNAMQQLIGIVAADSNRTYKDLNQTSTLDHDESSSAPAGPFDGPTLDFLLELIDTNLLSMLERPAEELCECANKKAVFASVVEPRIPTLNMN